KVRVGGFGVDLDRLAAQDDRLLIPFLDPQGHTETEGRLVVSGVVVEGVAEFGPSLRPVAGFRKGAQETDARRTVVGGQLSCSAVGGQGVFHLANDKQSLAQALMDPGVVRS